MDFPNLDQDFPSYEAVESIISSIDSRLFVIFPSLFCPILFYKWPFEEPAVIFYFIFFWSWCFVCCYLFCLVVLLFFCFFDDFFVFYFHFLVSSISPSLLNIPPYFLVLLFPPLVLSLLEFVALDEFQFVRFRLKTADLLFLGRDDACKRSVISDLSVKDERIRVLESNFFRSILRNFLLRRRALELETPYSRASVIGGIKFNLSDFGELQTARRLWRDYSARRGAVVYVVNVDTIVCNIEEWEARRYLDNVREDLNNLLRDEDFEMVPFLILCMTAAGALKEEVRTLLEEELCTSLDLTNMRTGRGRVDLAGRNVRPLEVFVAEQSNRRHLDAIMWLSQYFE